MNQNTRSVMLMTPAGPRLITAPAALKRLECRVQEGEKPCGSKATMVWLAGDGKFSDMSVCPGHHQRLIDEAVKQGRKP